jgi:hypothetical protein
MKLTPTEEKRLFQAVALTRSMIDAGNSPAAATALAAARFNVDRGTVEKLVTVAIQECKQARKMGLDNTVEWQR